MHLTTQISYSVKKSRIVNICPKSDSRCRWSLSDIIFNMFTSSSVAHMHTHTKNTNLYLISIWIEKNERLVCRLSSIMYIDDTIPKRRKTRKKKIRKSHSINLLCVSNPVQSVSLAYYTHICMSNSTVNTSFV